MLTREFVAQLPEDRLRQDVLVPLFRAMGFLDVRIQHGGPLEQGKDIVMWKRDEIRERVNYAVVVKSKPITGQAIGTSSAAEVTFQVQQTFGRPFQDASTLEDQAVHRCLVACPHDLRKEAQNSISGALDQNLRKNVDFICGDRLWSLVERHLGPRAVAQKLSEAGESMEGASAHHRVVARVRGSEIVFGIEAKHPDAALMEPLLFRGQFVFSNDDAGRDALGKLEAHVKRGSPVTLDAPYIKSWQVPDLLRPFMGDQVQQISLASAPSNAVLQSDLVIETPSGRSETVLGLRLRGLQRGTEEMTVVSDPQDGPYRLKLVATPATRRINISLGVDISGLNVRRALEGIRFRNAMAEGGQLTIRSSDTGLPIVSGDLPAGLVEPTPDRFEDFLADLVFIQAKTKCAIAIPERDFEARDASTVRSLAHALRSGVVNHEISDLNLTLTRDGIEKLLAQPSTLGDIAVVTEETERVCETDVPVGKVARLISGLEVTPDEVTRLHAELAAGQELISVTLTPRADGGQARFVFLDHLPAEERARYPQFGS